MFLFFCFFSKRPGLPESFFKKKKKKKTRRVLTDHLPWVLGMLH